MACRSEIGLKIKHVRIDKGLTQVQVSKLTRINKTTISEIENGRFTGSFDIFERLLNAVDLPPSNSYFPTSLRQITVSYILTVRFSLLLPTDEQLTIKVIL